jgi:hypothetical protein
MIPGRSFNSRQRGLGESRFQKNTPQNHEASQEGDLEIIILFKGIVILFGRIVILFGGIVISFWRGTNRWSLQDPTPLQHKFNSIHH